MHGLLVGVVVWVAYDAHYIWHELGIAMTSLGIVCAW